MEVRSLYSGGSGQTTESRVLCGHGIWHRTSSRTEACSPLTIFLDVLPSKGSSPTYDLIGPIVTPQSLALGLLGNLLDMIPCLVVDVVVVVELDVEVTVGSNGGRGGRLALEDWQL